MISRRPTIFAYLLVCLGAGMTAFGAGPAPADKQAFLGRQKMYLSFEITETGTREYGAGTPKDALTDGAHRVNRSVKFEVPLEMAVPGSFPQSSLPLATEEMMEQDRFIGWMAVSRDDPAVEQQLATGKLDLARNAMFLPIEFSIDDVRQSRYRDTPTEGWASETSTFKGRGVAYIARSGMLTCDLKKMTCDINNVLADYQDGSDLVTVTSASDVPGFVAKTEKQAPGLLLPKISEALAKRLIGFTISLPEPITMTFSGPSSAGTQQGGGAGTSVTVKVMLSPNPAAKSAGASR